MPVRPADAARSSCDQPTTARAARHCPGKIAPSIKRLRLLSMFGTIHKLWLLSMHSRRHSRWLRGYIPWFRLTLEVPPNVVHGFMPVAASCAGCGRSSSRQKALPTRSSVRISSQDLLRGEGTIREHVSAINAIPGVNWQLPPLPNLRACHTVTWHQSELHKRLQLIHKQRDSHVPIP